MRQIIVLETNPADGGVLSIRAAFWFPVTVGQEVPNPTLVSAVKGTAAPTAQEMTDLQDGKVKEEVRNVIVPDNYNVTQTKAALVAFYTRRSTYLAALPFQGQYYGVSYNGTVWSA